VTLPENVSLNVDSVVDARVLGMMAAPVGGDFGLFGASGSSFADWYRPGQLQTFHRTHEFRSNGTHLLPLGPNQKLLSSAPSWVSRIVERWQLGGLRGVRWIASAAGCQMSDGCVECRMQLSN
jgi:hypothetical protein